MRGTLRGPVLAHRWPDDDQRDRFAGQVAARVRSGAGHRALRSRALSDCRARRRAAIRYSASRAKEPFPCETALLEARLDRVPRRPTRAFAKMAEPGKPVSQGVKDH